MPPCGDYICTSFLAGQQRVLNAFAIGFAPTTNGLLNETDVQRR
jgi:hypothetical protein